jgi:hypothetical protein
VVAELLDLPEDLVHVAGVLAEDAALEEERIPLVRTIAHLTPADQPLVRVDADERDREGRADDRGDPKVGDPQRRGLRRAVHVRLHEGGGCPGCGFARKRDAARRAQAERLEERPPIG